MTTSEVWLIGAALSAGAALQGAIGFGSAVLSVQVMVWGGLSLPEAVAASLAMVVVQTAAGVRQFRGDLVWADVRPMFVYRVIGMPVGLAVMAWLSGLDASAVKQVVGGLVLLAVALVALDLRVAKHEHAEAEEAPPPRAWDPVAGLGSGLMAGAVGMGGPALVLWAHMRHWPTRRTRVFLWCSFLLISPLQLALMGWRFGPALGWMMLLGLASTPLVVAAAWLGTKAGDRLSVRQFRGAALLLLALMGLASVVSPWWGGPGS